MEYEVDIRAPPIGFYLGLVCAAPGHLGVDCRREQSLVVRVNTYLVARLSAEFPV